MKKYLCLDVGRTKFRYAVMTEELDLLEQGKEYCDIYKKEEIFDPIKTVCDKYRGDVEGLSVTMPGVIDRKKGFAYSGGVYEWVRNVPYADMLSEYVDMPVVIANDAKAAAMAEIGYGSLKRVQNGMMVMVLNTGIGGCIVTEGKILDGQHFAAGEFSYMRGDYKAPDNEYSDMFALSSSISGMTSEIQKTTGRELNAFRIIAKIQAGDERVREGLERYMDMLGNFIYNIQCVVDSEVCVIGGSLADDPLYIKFIREAVKRKFDNAPFQNIFMPEIRECTFHSNARMFGAVYNFRELMEKKDD